MLSKPPSECPRTGRDGFVNTAAVAGFARFKKVSQLNICMRTKTALTAAGTIATATVAAAVAYRRGHSRGSREAEFDRETTSFDELIEQKREMVENDRREKMRRLEMQIGARKAMGDIGDDFEGTPAELFERVLDDAEERTADGDDGENR